MSKNKKDTHLHIRIDSERKEKIEEYADKEKETVSEFVIKSVDDRIEGLRDEEKRD